MLAARSVLRAIELIEYVISSIDETVARTADWYRGVEAGDTSARTACIADLDAYCSAADWAQH